MLSLIAEGGGAFPGKKDEVILYIFCYAGVDREPGLIEMRGGYGADTKKGQRPYDSTSV